MVSIPNWSQMIDIPKPEWIEETPSTQPELTHSSPNFCISNTKVIQNPFQHMTPKQLAEALSNPLNHPRPIVVADARFSYEFQGGKIRSAENIHSKESIIKLYEKYRGRDVSIIFHCEFSHDRGPTVMAQFREYDRTLHRDTYPDLEFPHIYLLDGGYSSFYAQYPEFCVGGYTQMREQKYCDNGQLKFCNNQYKVEFKTPRIPRCSSQPIPFTYPIISPPRF